MKGINEFENDPNFVSLGYTLSNADNQADFVLNRLDDGICSGRRWDIEYSCVRLSFAHGLEGEKKSEEKVRTTLR